MNFVQPIRDPDVVSEIKNYFKNNNERNYIMFLLGIYLGRRVTDILNLKVKDVRDKDHIIIIEGKTKKRARIDFHPELKKALKIYCQDKLDYEYLIKSRKGKNRPISRCTAYSILKKAANEFGIDSLGTHSMRKTCAYHLYINSGGNVALVMKFLNHEDQTECLSYIGIESDQINRALRSLKF